MEQVFSYIISLGASVMMPNIFTVIGLYFVNDMAPDFTLAANQFMQQQAIMPLIPLTDSQAVHSISHPLSSYGFSIAV